MLHAYAEGELAVDSQAADLMPQLAMLFMICQSIEDGCKIDAHMLGSVHGM